MQGKPIINGVWSSHWIFIFAATGSAIGLGNVLKFPYLVSSNGGGAFILLYLVCLLLVGTPIMIAEVFIGRSKRQNPVYAIRNILQESGCSGRWSFVALAGVLSGFLIFSFYSVVIGWVLSYVVGISTGDFIGIGMQEAKQVFYQLRDTPETILRWHSFVVFVVMLIIVGGVNRGLENAIKFLMPVLFILLAALLGYALQTGNFTKGFYLLFSIDFSKLGWDSVLSALKHAFFTLSIGVGVMMAYGAYMPKQASIGSSIFLIVLLDMLIALLAGLAILPMMITNNMEPAYGMDLMFVTLPVAFGHMQAGQTIGFIFFLLVTTVALTSAISLMEPVTTWLSEHWGWSRLPTCIFLGIMVWAFGVTALGSFSFLSHVEIMGFNLFYFYDFVATNIIMPLVGLFVAILAGWIVNKRILSEELAMKSVFVFNLWHITVRYISPLAVGSIVYFMLVEKLSY